MDQKKSEKLYKYECAIENILVALKSKKMGEAKRICEEVLSVNSIPDHKAYDEIDVSISQLLNRIHKTRDPEYYGDAIRDEEETD